MTWALCAIFFSIRLSCSDNRYILSVTYNTDLQTWSSVYTSRAISSIVTLQRKKDKVRWMALLEACHPMGSNEPSLTKPSRICQAPPFPFPSPFIKNAKIIVSVSLQASSTPKWVVAWVPCVASFRRWQNLDLSDFCWSLLPYVHREKQL